jgi:hypothetical protein
MLNGINTFAPQTQYSRFSGPVIPTVTPTLQVLSTAGGALTMTVAQLFAGLLTPDVQDAQTWTTPTAAAIVAAIEGCQVGAAVDLDLTNYGDSTVTIGLGTGVTKVTIAGVAAVMTVLTLATKRFRFVVTNATVGSEAVVVYVVGGFAGAVA